MVKPYAKKMGLLGLGTSVGGQVRPRVLKVKMLNFFEQVLAPVVVVRNFSQLSESVSGKIVLFNYICDWKANPDYCYGAMATYRVDGASQAARFGAVASLTRSLTGVSIYTPHTGVQHYANDVQKIPTACITTEDSDLLQRLSDRGVEVVLNLTMNGAEAFVLPKVSFSNQPFYLQRKTFRLCNRPI